MQLKDFPLSITVAACVAGAVLVANVFAGPKERPASIDLAELGAADEKRFARADADGDGLVSEEEFAALDPRQLAAGFRQRGERGQRGRQGGGAAGRKPAADREAVRQRAAERRAEVEKRRQAARDREFETGDADGDGQLSVEEYRQIPATARAARQRQMFARLDENSDGALTPEEFPSAVARLKSLDADGDGLVTREELRAGRRR